ncbi:ArsR/SmtB family transcription factor [Brucella pseudogrignonensis]
MIARTQRLLTRQQAQSIAEFLSAMSSAKRIEMLCLLNRREMSAEELAETIGASQSAVFRHLVVLNSVSLLGKRKVAKTIYYKLGPEAMARIQTFQKFLEQAQAIESADREF